MIGAAACFQFELLRKNLLFAFVVGALLFVLGIQIYAELFLLIGLSLVVVTLGFATHIFNYVRDGDLSCGVNVWQFPIIQILVGQALFAASPYLAVLLALALTFAAAFSSLHLTVWPVLCRSDHHVTRATGQATPRH